MYTHTTKNINKSQQDQKCTEAKGWRYSQNMNKHFKKKKKYKHFQCFPTFPSICIFMV